MKNGRYSWYFFSIGCVVAVITLVSWPPNISRSQPDSAQSGADNLDFKIEKEKEKALKLNAVLSHKLEKLESRKAVEKPTRVRIKTVPKYVTLPKETIYVKYQGMVTERKVVRVNGLLIIDLDSLNKSASQELEAMQDTPTIIDNHNNIELPAKPKSWLSKLFGK